MGCCFSRSEGPNSPYPGGVPSASARAINVPHAVAAAAAPAAAAGVAQGDHSDGTVSSSPATIASQRSRTRTAAVPANVSRLPPPQETLAQHINKPLRRRRWTSRNRVWTRHSIDRERVDFFDTRVTGRPEIWQTLHTALEILWEADLVAAARRSEKGSDAETQARTDGGGTAAATTKTPTTTTTTATTTSKTKKEEDTDLAEARATAQSIIDAADITLPTGDMAQGAYDAFGNFYALPAWIVSDPTNLDDDPEHELDETKGALDIETPNESDFSNGEAVEDDQYSEDDDDDEETCGDEARQQPDGQDQNRRTKGLMRRRREEKGKAVAAAGAHQVAVRARLSVSSRDVVVRLGRDETVRSLAHRISEKAKLPHNTRIRIAYLGKILKEGAPLAAQGWKEGHVVNALVFDTNPS